MTKYTLILGILAGAVLYYWKEIAEDWKLFCTDKKQWLYDKWKNWGEPFMVAAVLAAVIRIFLLGPYKIPTGSMIPTFMVNDKIFVDKITYLFRPPRRGEIIVFKYPLDDKEFRVKWGGYELTIPFVDARRDFVKRLAGLPGDKIEIREGKLVINGKVMDEPPFSKNYYYNRDDWTYGKKSQLIAVPQNHYFALGDNSAQSSDSRNWGFVPAKNLVGRAFFIWWPLKRIKLVH